MRAYVIAFALVLLPASTATIADDQNGGTGPYAIERSSADSGGGVSSGKDFSLQGTIGPISAGPTSVIIS